MMDLLHQLAQLASPIVVAAVAPWVAKKIHDRDVREALSQAADAALVLAVKKSDSFSSYGELLRAVVAGILTNPAVTNDPVKAEYAAAAAIARNSVGVAKLPG